MKVNCPHCCHEYDIEPNQLGQSTECEACQKIFILKNPNLITCPICFKEISKDTGVCLRCGHLLKRKKS